MSDQLQDYMCNLDGDLVLDSETPANTSGAFCDLLTATHPTAGKLALKRPRGNCYDESVLDRIETEASIWKMLRHPHILQFMGIYKIGEDIYLVSPFAENGSLPGFLRARPHADRKRLVIEIAEGLTYLHQCRIIHGDLKGNNTLISGEEHVLLCDFGLAKHVTSRTSTSLRGTGSIPWQSPELLRDGLRRTFQSDVYAFGITISEVLSGNEPYTHHHGIGSIITGVLFSGERPLKEPMTAPDGTSYLQLWEEASKCWDEDPLLRPSMLSVLKRLDPERVGMWITAQHIALETSLDSPGDLRMMMSYSEPVSDGALGIAQAKETLRWVESIRTRLDTFANSKQPISRITPELLAAIIWRDNTGVKLHSNHPLSSSRNLTFYGQEVRSTILRLFRWMKLRQVSKSWRNAIDTSTQLCSLVWADSDRSNAGYIQQCNPDGPLECVISGGRPPLSTLRPLASRISRISVLSPGEFAAQLLQGLAFPKLHQMRFLRISEPGLVMKLSISLRPLTNPITAVVLGSVASIAFEHAAFSSLQTIKIADIEVHDTFVVDLFAMFSASPNVAELVLKNLRPTKHQYTPPPAPVVHRGLQRMRLVGVPSPILSPILLFLEAENPMTLFVDNTDPSHLPDPTSPFAKNLLSSIRSCYAPENNAHLSVNTDYKDQSQVTLRWPASLSVKLDQPRLASAGETWDFNYIETPKLSDTDASKVLDVLFDTGITVDRVTLDGPKALLLSLGILARLDTVKRMAVTILGVDSLLMHLSGPIPIGVTGSLQYFCPRLIHLEMLDQAYHWQGYPAFFRKLITRRQAAANTSDGPARLEKVGVPPHWVKKMEGDDSTFDGVEIFSTTRWESW